jgi:hypothetical protein
VPKHPGGDAAKFLDAAGIVCGMTWADVLAVPGFSSPSNRGVLNYAVSMVPRARILEVGSFKGSTAVAMCHDNAVECIHMIDNHTEFGDTRQELAATCQRFGLPATIHDLDWFAPLPADVFGGTRFNVYLYDGPHEEGRHAAELAIAWPHLADEFLYIVDDYSWPQVRAGCDAGLFAMADRLKVGSKNIYKSDVLNDSTGFWNGLLVAWCEKK